METSANEQSYRTAILLVSIICTAALWLLTCCFRALWWLVVVAILPVVSNPIVLAVLVAGGTCVLLLQRAQRERAGLRQRGLLALKKRLSTFFIAPALCHFVVPEGVLQRAEQGYEWQRHEGVGDEHGTGGVVVLNDSKQVKLLRFDSRKGARKRAKGGSESK